MNAALSNGMDSMAALWHGFLLIELGMVLAWVAYLFSGQHNVVDVFWPMAFLLLAGSSVAHFGVVQPEQLLALMALLIWAFRLALFLFWTRLRKGHSDARYQRLSAAWSKPRWQCLLNFLIQGVFAWVIALPLFFVFENMKPWSLVAWLGISVSLLAILFEAIADIQLHHFKRWRRKGVCQEGWWRYSRHPNYFFEWCVWLGFAVASIHDYWSLLALLSPLTLLFVFYRITGPLTEQVSLQHHQEAYRKYQQCTSFFVPMSQRKQESK
jgi:steroid 5-alpha reductase family enzyme